jgi:formate dehydrogenase maturation protein FdhE
MLTPEEYAKHKGGVCPVCGDTSLEGVSAFDMDGGGAMQHIRCRACGAEWWDCYALTGYCALMRDGKPVR